MSISRCKALAIAGATLSAGVVCGFGVVAYASQPDATDARQEAPSAEQVRKVIEQRVGPSAPPQKGDKVVTGPWVAGEPAPDLTPVDLENGTSGFLRVFDLAKPTSELKTRKVDEKTTEFILPVYAEDGQTVIGEFVAGTATEE